MGLPKSQYGSGSNYRSEAVMDKVTGIVKRILKNENKIDYWPLEFDSQDKENYNRVLKFTGTGLARAQSLMAATKYIVKNQIPGDFIECGIAAGGSSMLMALTLLRLDAEHRNIYMYDLFGEFPPFNDYDFEISSGKSVSEYKDRLDKGESDVVKNWSFTSLEEVQKNMRSTHYPSEHLHYCKGDVSKTLMNSPHQEVALLRLDTDFYESTKFELETLYPKIVTGGIVIIDDYGHWNGSKRAVDEYFSELKIQPFMNIIDYSARLIVKL